MEAIEPLLVWEDDNNSGATSPKKEEPRMIFFPSLVAVRIIERMVGK
jgi:hypothetical protein